LPEKLGTVRDMLAHSPGTLGRDVTSPSVLRVRLFLLIALPGALAGFLFAVTVAAPSAFGAELVFASPAQGAQLHEAPGSVQLSFDGFVMAGSTLDVQGPNGSAELGKERRSGITLTQRLQPSLPAGVYTVAWQVELRNGDVSTGSYVFTVVTNSDSGRDRPTEPTRQTDFPTDTATTTETAQPSQKWTPSAQAEQTSQVAAMIADTDSPTSTGTGQGNVAVGLFSLLAAAGIAGTLFYGWRSGWWVQNPAPAVARSRRGSVETNEMPRLTFDDD
jgi:methionine-rich copper-binding protein CopC